MDVARTAELATAVNQAKTAQSLSMAAVKQQQQSQQAVVSIIEQATEQAKAATDAATAAVTGGHSIDIIT